MEAVCERQIIPLKMDRGLARLGPAIYVVDYALSQTATSSASDFSSMVCRKPRRRLATRAN